MESLPEASPIRYELRNRGPWVTMEFQSWPGFQLGQTTALASTAGAQFSSPDVVDYFVSHLPARTLHVPRQVHGTGLEVASGPSACYPGCDGLIGVRAGDALTVVTADCLPIYVANESGSRFGLLHAGWRGLVRGILPEALNTYFRQPVRLMVGAHVDADAYEVGEDVVEEVSRSLGLGRKQLVSAGVLDAESHLDLFQVLRHQAAGSDRAILELRRLPFGTVSAASPPLHSYRETGTDKRMLHWLFSVR